MSDLSIELTAPNGRKYTQPTGLFINNEFVPSKSGAKIASINPTDEAEIATVHAAEAEDIDIAVKAARNALKDPSWRDLSPTDRGNLMIRFADIIEKNKELLATIDAWDNGKPYTAALNDDLADVIGTIRYYGGYADKFFGQTISTTPLKFAYTIRQPIGVVGQIIPWNYPLAMAGWKLGPALACGNTIVLKPAEQTPLSALVLGTLIKEAGFPPGVINILNGHGKDAGAALVSHPDVDKVAFTGSTATARQIMKLASGTLKNITLETGGKSPLLVFEDADMEQAVKWAHYGIMSNQGQICTATSRILVQENVYESFIKSYMSEIKTASIVGDPFAEETFQGPQVTKQQYEKILSYVDIGKKEGATLSAGGTPKDGKGFFVSPTVFTNVNPEMTIWKEEVFGPFAVIGKFSDEEDAVKQANNTTYGLGAAVFTKDLERAIRVSRDIEAGMVWVNSSQDSDFRIPFGGVKQSGIGRELGEEGLHAYSQVKAVHINMGTKL